MKILNYTHGSDFEMFVRKIGTNDIVPCPARFGGTKAEPLSIGEFREGMECFRQIDNCSAEFNIPVVDNVDDWVTAYEYCITKGNEILNPLGLELVAKTSHVFDPEQFTQERHTTFGCEPSYCAYDWDILSPNAAEAGSMRSTGAHIHIGFSIADGGFNGDVVRRLMMCMDKCLGVPSLDIDPDRERRKLYGVAGDFRDKFLDKDGNTLEEHQMHLATLCILEYRSLGGALVDDPAFLFNGSKEAVELYNSDYVFTAEEIETQRNQINHKIEVKQLQTV